MSWEGRDVWRDEDDPGFFTRPKDPVPITPESLCDVMGRLDRGDVVGAYRILDGAFGAVGAARQLVRLLRLKGKL